MHERWKLRRAAAHEAQTLSELARLAKAHWGYPEAWLAIWTSSLSFSTEYLVAHDVTVAERGDRLVGVCALEDHAAHWELGHLWVSPAHHGEGIGRALVEHALAVAAAHRTGVLRVVADPNAARFYERLGGRHVRDVAAAMPGAAARVLPEFEFLVQRGRDNSNVPRPRNNWDFGP